MIVSSDSIRVQHLVEICGLSLAGGTGVNTSATFSDSSLKLVVASAGLALLLASSPCYDSSGFTMAAPWPCGCSVSCYCV